MQGWTYAYGGVENTLAGMKHALQLVKSHAFICVWTDTYGLDIADAAVRAEVKRLKASTESEIFVMAVTSSYPLADFQAQLGDVATVMDISKDPNVVSKMITQMKNSAICKKSAVTSI